MAISIENVSRIARADINARVAALVEARDDAPRNARVLNALVAVAGAFALAYENVPSYDDGSTLADHVTTANSVVRAGIIMA